MIRPKNSRKILAFSLRFGQLHFSRDNVKNKALHKGVSCKNTSYTPGIKMHQFPSDPKGRAEWLKFVQRHRVDFGEPVNKHAALFSAHFEPSCYSMAFGLSLEGMEKSK